MELENPSNGVSGGGGDLENTTNSGDFENPTNGDDLELDSSCSTPYVSAPSSPGRGPVPSYFFSAPASPMHYVLSSSAFTPVPAEEPEPSVSSSFEFEFSARGSMISADELFLNGQIRPMRLASHLQRPQALAPLLDLDEDDEDDDCGGGRNRPDGVRGRDPRLRSRSVHRRTRSMSPLRHPRFQWAEEEDEGATPAPNHEADPDLKQIDEPTASASASSSRSSSSGRNSKRWIFLKDLLYSSKSEGRGNGKEKEKFWLSISFSPSKEKDKDKDKSKPPAPPPSSQPAAAAEKPKKAVPWTKRAAAGQRRPSAHERLYTANRAQAEEMRRRTFLPYRQGLLGCLGFSSRSYGAVSGLAKTLNPVSSR